MMRSCSRCRLRVFLSISNIRDQKIFSTQLMENSHNENEIFSYFQVYSTEEGKSSRMSTKYQSEKEYDEAIRNIADFMDALEHGEQATVGKTISDRKEMNPPSGGLSPLQVVQASTSIGPYIDPIRLYMHSHAMEAILQPERSFQVPKSDLHHDKRPAVSPVQVVQHHQDLISEYVKMGGTINFCSHLPILSTELHGKGRASSVSQVDGTTLLGVSNGELDGLFFNSQQADCLLLNSSVIRPEEPEPEGYQRLMERIIAETTNIYPNGSSLVTESPKGPPVCQMQSEGRGEWSRNDISPTCRLAQGWNAHVFDLNQSLQSRRHIITYFMIKDMKHLAYLLIPS